MFSQSDAEFLPARESWDTVGGASASSRYEEGRGGERRKRERRKPDAGVRWGEGWMARARHERCYKLEKGSREMELSIEGKLMDWEINGGAAGA